MLFYLQTVWKCKLKRSDSVSVRDEYRKKVPKKHKNLKRFKLISRF